MGNPTPERIVEALGVSVGGKSMAAGAATGVVGFLSQVNWIGVVGVLVAVLGLAVNVFFQIRRDHRESVEHAARLEKLHEHHEQ